MEEIMDKLKEIEGLIDSSKKLPQGIIESLEYESKMLFTYLTLKIALGKLTNTLDIKDLERIKSLKNNFEIVKERKNEIFDEKVENDVLNIMRCIQAAKMHGDTILPSRQSSNKEYDVKKQK
ncbi:hypothetical protein CWI37_0153p0020 [Hamiltosporidium tvaerminnensis]|uniref:Uncharacterized protein n=1 Tax=Hamiltosporidium tvaerminnensis TaxID=1176355 RepID=A0A4Q9L992_9MICR|nr:hypothetical protein CWI37_0153p0020 [Hamiltosporidium tvaerminnensis]